MPKILLLQGPPATGKSTFRKQFIAQNTDWRYINLDELREAEKDLPEHQRLDIMWNTAVSFANESISFIVDNTNINPKTVRQWELFAQTHGYEFEVKQFYVPYTQAVMRDLERTSPVGKSVIWKMFVDNGYDPSPGFKQKAIIIDLDGTACDVEHRRHYVSQKPKQWDAFYAELVNDPVNLSVFELYKMAINSGYRILFVSGRPAQWRKHSEVWLKNNGFGAYDLLLMRSFNDKRDDTIIKEEIYTKYIEPYYTVVFTVDDRDRVVKMWREKGLTCFQVAEGNF